LVQKSFLQMDAGGRYGVHELLRQYGAEQLGHTPEEEQRLKDLQAALPGAHKEANLEAQGETKTQREAAAGVSPASSAFAGVAKALGLDTLPGHASKAFEQVATSYTALLQKMEQEAAVAGSKINTLLYEGFVGRLKQDLTDEVNRS
jgi:hypothetical protein